jgi:hypothetical protein
MSLSVEPEMKVLLENSAKKMGWSTSELVRKLVNKHLNLVVNDGEEIPIILRVPSALKGNAEEIKLWLTQRVEGIAQKLSM